MTQGNGKKVYAGVNYVFRCPMCGASHSEVKEIESDTTYTITPKVCAGKCGNMPMQLVQVVYGAGGVVAP